MIVLFITEVFYPPNNPRAIRAFEFVRQFLLDGFRVVVLTKDKIRKEQLGKDGRIKRIENLDLISYSQYISEKTMICNTNNKPRSNFFSFSDSRSYYKLKKIVLKILNCIYPFFKQYPLLKSLIHTLNKFPIEPCLIYANAWPVYIPLALCRAEKFNQKLKKKKIFKIVELSDPILENPNLCKYSPKLRKIEFEIISYFDLFIFPNKKTANTYTKYKKVFQRMLILPLTLSKQLIQLSSYHPNPIPTFAYAGSFYYDIRNPTFLFNFLSRYKKPFKFFFFGDLKNLDNLFFLKKFYAKLSNKLVIKDSIDVYELIKYLSQMDFLINLENLSSVQIPSKNYIYMLSKRPVISFNEKNFLSSKFSYILDNWKKIDQILSDKTDSSKLVFTEDIWKNFVSQILKQEAFHSVEY